jgi:NADH:ubiquinone oxidoreductase subunit 4 (subunit M)
MTPFIAFLRLELSDALRSRWVAFASTLYLGIYPAAVFDLTQASVDNLVAVYRAAIGA